MASATLRQRKAEKPVEYPTSDGKPMAETDLHRNVMFALISMLEHWFADNPMVYVSGNMLVYYVKGDKRKHVSPDVFVVLGLTKTTRDYFLCWEEGKTPNCVIEVTSKTTKREDIQKKLALYRDVLKVKEYFLFDPRGEYLEPRLQGYRLQRGDHVRIPLVDGRMPSKVLNLHLEAHGADLRLYNPDEGNWLLTPVERADHAEERAELAENRAGRAEERAEKLAGELETLRRELQRRGDA